MHDDVPLTERFPDWRILGQQYIWLTKNGRCVPLDEMPVADVEALLDVIRSDALDWHAQAASDEWYATSSAMRWAFQQLDVPMIGETHPQVWLNSTPLIREMQRLVNDSRTQ